MSSPHPEEFVKSESSRAEHEPDHQEPQELVAVELQEGLVWGQDTIKTHFSLTHATKVCHSFPSPSIHK